MYTYNLYTVSICINHKRLVVHLTNSACNTQLQGSMQRYPTPAGQGRISESHFNLNPACNVHWLISSLRQIQVQALETYMLTPN